MNLNLLFCVACSAALLLGACSSGNPPAPDGNGDSNGNDQSGNDQSGNDQSGDSAQTQPDPALTAYQNAQNAVMRAITEAQRATPDNREEAEGRIVAARTALDDAVKSAEAALAAAVAGSPEHRAADGFLNRVKDYKTRQEMALNDLQSYFAWFGREVKRSAISSGDVVTPAQGANTVEIDRTPRTEDDGNGNQVANDDAIKSGTFKYVMYSADKVLLSGGGRKSSGSVTKDKFKVDGYVVGMTPSLPLDTRTFTGLTLTSTGLSIRVGGTRRVFGDNREMTDYTDMRKDITAHVDDADADGHPNGVSDRPRGQNGWDLTIAFNEPVQGPTSASGGRTSWQGNGDFYWRGIVEAAPSQLLTSGDNHRTDAFNQPDGTQHGEVDQRDLGTYEVWLSNHFELDTKAEPSGSNAGRNPTDDFDGYLNYAAYGLFVYTASSGTFRDGTNGGHESRVQSMNFGYQAFADEDGKRTRDIGTSITSAIFVGETLATIIEGSQSDGNQRTTLLRGEAELAVTIPKGSNTAGRIRGRLDGFEQWFGTYWREYKPNTAGAFSVRLDNGTDGTFVNIEPNGSYDGTATAANVDIGLGSSGVGTFKGNFYGPRADPDDLETAGSWNVGPGTTGRDPAATSIIIGSFGAKQYDRES